MKYCQISFYDIEINQHLTLQEGLHESDVRTAAIIFHSLPSTCITHVPLLVCVCIVLFH